MQRISLKLLNSFIVLSLLVSSLSACDSDEPDPEAAPFVETVATLSSGFAANDAISIDAAGNLYVSEYGVVSNTTFRGDGFRVLKVSSEGVAELIPGRFSGPTGNHLGADGRLYINNDNNYSRGLLLAVNPTTGQRDTVATIPGFSTGLNADASGNLYTANFLSGTIHKIDASGGVSVFASDARLAGCTSIDFDSQGNLITSNFSTADILSITPSGEVRKIASLADIVDDYGFGIGYATVLDDVIYATGISDKVNKIFKITLEGTVSEFAGSGAYGQQDGTLAEATFRQPNGIVADKQKKILYISEYSGGGGLRKICLANQE